MKKFLAILLAAMLCLTVFVAPVLAEEEEVEEGVEDEYYSQDFQLRNSTGVQIEALYISPSEEENWSENCLVESFVPDSIVNVVFDVVATDGYTWDISIEDGEGNTIDFFGITLAEIRAIDLTYADGVGTAYTYEEAFE